MTALLLSGGMDSIAIAFWRRPQIAITVDYGQRPAAAEIRAAGAVCQDLDISHHVIRTDLSSLGSGDMAGSTPLEVAPVSEWWPFRNQMLITVAAMKGISLGVKRVLIGALATDCRHADGTREFIACMDALLRCQEGSIALEAPAIEWTAAQLIRASGVPIEILAWAHSCHTANEACGTCSGCRKHFETYAELGHDPY
ncbi:MAG: asparagine synthase family protein [Bryobacterales bacterium]|nr:asparagine synthase family protein [Bryobacterales bacterium]